MNSEILPPGCGDPIPDVVMRFDRRVLHRDNHLGIGRRSGKRWAQERGSTRNDDTI
jgi:hypothetical protein